MLVRVYQFLLTTALLIVASLSQAVDVKVEFSAEAVQIAPQRPTVVARMFVSKKAVRTESKINNQELVEIVFPEEGRRIMLFPQQQNYVEQTGMPKKSSAVSQEKNFNPCTGVPDTECKKLGKEKVQGRQAEKWEIIAKREGKTLRSLHWIDVKRKMPLRESYADGSFSELKLLKKEKLNGRKTEIWQLDMTRGDGKRMSSKQWYDTQLKMMIREELPGGYVRELRNIKVSKQAKKLFEIPNGYQRRPAPSAAPVGMSSGIPAKP
ncbi:MAG: hypothetical protein OEY52_13515 [Gammaproteobacteria bacterium]|nr:hypothetical protein [Gammaproteobacteria bacterium]